MSDDLDDLHFSIRGPVGRQRLFAQGRLVPAQVTPATRRHPENDGPYAFHDIDIPLENGWSINGSMISAKDEDVNGLPGVDPDSETFRGKTIVAMAHNTREPETTGVNDSQLFHFKADDDLKERRARLHAQGRTSDRLGPGGDLHGHTVTARITPSNIHDVVSTVAHLNSDQFGGHEQ